MFRLILFCVFAVLFFYKITLQIVEYRSAKNPTPENVSDVYDAETYLKWKRYNADHAKLSLVFTVISSAISFVLLYTNAYAAFASLFGAGAILQLLSVIILETVSDVVIGTVEGYINTMVIEQKYGFNRSTVKTFVFDRIRSTILGFVLSFGLVWLLYALHTALGDYMILLFAGVLFAVTLLISFLYPIFSRMGNKFTPLEDGELKDRLLELLKKHGYHVKGIEVMDASRRTTKLNAYFTGFGKMKTIVLYDNLLNAMSTEEICAVFAHELGHGLHKDVLKQQVLNIVNLLLMAVLIWASVKEPRFYTEFGFADINYGFAYVIFGILLGAVQPFTGILITWNSRRAEYRADRQAVAEGYGEALVTALKKLARENFAHLAPSKLNVILEYSHPPLSERILAIEQEMKR
jgi:STE24 endopeptidase